MYIYTCDFIKMNPSVNIVFTFILISMYVFTIYILWMETNIKMFRYYLFQSEYSYINYSKNGIESAEILNLKL